MADRRRKSGVANITGTNDTNMGSGAMGKSPKEKKTKKPKERWLLTRKTWRYMADAGRKLIPDGALNRAEDVPKIEAYFQEVCQKEPRFLLWRKGSYPGALGFRSNRRRKDRRKGGSCRTKASSADEADDIKKAVRPSDLALVHSSGGRFDIQKLKYDFLNKPTPTNSPTHFNKTGRTLTSLKEQEGEENQLVNMLERYLTIAEEGPSATSSSSPAFDYQELIDKLQQHLTTVYKTNSSTSAPSTSRKFFPERVHFEGDHVQKSLSETLSRYYSRSSNREHVISDLLTNRKLLEGLYFDLRRTKGFRNTRVGFGDYGNSNINLRSTLRRHTDNYDTDDDSDSLEIAGWKRLGKPISKFQDHGQMSPPPLIEIRGESQEYEPTYADYGIQTDRVPEHVLQQCDDEYKKIQAEKEQETKDAKLGYRRRSSVDNDDVSQSVSDTIKRYLRMARKKSVDSDKVDRFKRVNYDRNLRNIKAKGEITKPGDDDGLNKGCQTNDDWILKYRDFKFDEVLLSDTETSIGSHVTSSRSSYDAATGEEFAPVAVAKISSRPSSPPSGFLSSSQTFLSNLLHGKSSPTLSVSNAAAQAATMQKSKSSSSVMHHGSRLVAKKIFRSRSKSQSRIQATPSSWTPQGDCTWASVSGRQVTLNDVSLLQLSDIERRVLQKVALAKLQALNLGVAIRVPCETGGQLATKSKKRTYLLKRKAKTTGFFDTGRKEDKDKVSDGSSTTGLVFGIPLSQCLENDRLSRIARGGSPFRSGGDLPDSSNDTVPLSRQSRHGSRASFSSLIDSPRTEESGSCESLMSRERIAGSVPGLLDSLSCGSNIDLTSATTPEEEPGVPQMFLTCLRYLETHGLHTTGIFRVSSSKKRVRQLREDFDCGKEMVLDDEQCPHDVATLLKEYLRDLPDPLLCRDLYHAFVLTQRIRNRRLQLEAMQHLIQLLPVPNRDTLAALLIFLVSVAQNANDTKDAAGNWIPGNKMDSNNLATVFAPNILHCVKQSSSSKDVNIDRPEDRIDVINVIRTMIDHQKQLFTVPAELLDEIYVHMMDTHPEALDTLLNRRDTVGMSDADLLDDCDNDVSSNPWSPTMNTEMPLDTALRTVQSCSEFNDQQSPSETRKTGSREEFLHENAGTGGPNIAMRLRYRDRDKCRERLSKKRWRDDSSSRKKLDEISPNSNISSAMTVITRLRNQKDEEIGNQLSKMRSSSVDNSNCTQIENNDTHTRLLRVSSEDTYGNNRRQTSPLLLDNNEVITASLKIPVQSSNHNQTMALNLDDSDIPYIEDSSNYLTETSKKQIGLFKGPSAPPRRRQRSISGSDSSQTSNIQSITGSISVLQPGYDSAMGSSITFSSPPHNTAPSSVGSSIAGDGCLYSSPPSWASTPPTSPDSTHISVNYIPDDSPTNKFTTARVPITTQKLHIETNTNKESVSPILQKVSFASTSELQQIKPKQIDSQNKKETPKSQKDLLKSASITAIPIQKTDAEIGHSVREQKPSTSISSIGGAVLRSKTADFERLLQLGKSSEMKTKQTTSSSSEKKKYTKRRYTDSRHETRHIPDSETLEKATNSETRTKEKSSTSTQQPGPVYKRRELIASVPKDRHAIL